MELELLVSVFKKSNWKALQPEVAYENASMILECFEHHIDPAKVGEYLDLIFNWEDGLQKFLGDKLTIKTFNGSKEQILKLFKYIISHGEEKKDDAWKEAVLPFCKLIKDEMAKYWRNSKEPAKHQQIALDVMIAMLEIYGEQIDEVNYELPSLYYELLSASEKSAYQPSVRGKIFHLLGLIATVTRNGLFKDEKKLGVLKKLYEHVVKAVKVQVESVDSHLEVSILQGCLKAMDKLLQHFGLEIKALKNVCWNLFYTNLTQIIDPKCSITNDGSSSAKIKRREFQRAGLELVANNAKLLQTELFQRYMQWYQDLFSWSKANYVVDNRVGKKAMFSFLHAVFEFAMSETAFDSQSKKSCELEKFVTFFVNAFEEILDAETPRRNEVNVAITGIGLVSPLCADSPRALPLTEKIMNNINKIIFELNNSPVQTFGGPLYLIARYLETASRVLQFLMKEEEEPLLKIDFLSRLNSIEQLLTHFLLFFPELNEKYRKTSHFCVLKLITSLRSKFPHHCVPFVDRVLKSALSKIIASPTSAELQILDDAWEIHKQQLLESDSTSNNVQERLGLKSISSYTQIWINMGTCKTEQTSAKLLYDRILDWSLSALGKLNLTLIPFSEEVTTNSQDTFGNSGDMLSQMKPENSKDFQLFINLVDFLQIYMSNANFRFFETWVAIFIPKIIDYSVENPFASGFYKILGTSWEILRKLNYFNESKSTDVFEKCTLFLESVLKDTNSLHDDLLVSVLQLWLSAPDVLLTNNIDSLRTTLEKTFQMGRVQVQLADQSLDAIQRWMTLESFKREDMESIVSKLFPIWQTYFISEVINNEKGAISLRGNQTSSKKNKTKDMTQDLEVKSSEQRKKVRIKILQIIGSFSHIIDLENHLVDYSLEQDHKVLTFRIPLRDTSPDIVLDKFIPKVLILCETSNDRQLRTTACEFLHTAFIYFLGFSVRSNHSGSALFSKMFSTVMKLGGDPDFIVRQLFMPLAYQCIHWFTKKKDPYSETILRIIVDGICSDDGQVKESSTTCFAEYFEWSLRYDNNENDLVRDILNYLLALSTHAHVNNRIGASSGFNSIYRHFRAAKSLSNYYSIALMTSFLQSLAISEQFAEDSVVIKSTKISISHLEKIVARQNIINFNEISRRKKPSGFKTDSVCLNDFTEWLLDQITVPKLTFREECIRLLVILAPITSRGMGSISTFLQPISTDVKTVICRAEQCYKPDGTEENFQTVLSFLDSASAFYALFSTSKCLDLTLFENCGSRFLEEMEKMFKITIIAENVATIVRICSQFKEINLQLSTDLKSAYYQYLFEVSKHCIQEAHLTKLVKLFECPEVPKDIVITVIHEIDEILKTTTPSIPSVTLRNFRWLRVISENLRALLPESNVLQFRDRIWCILQQKLFPKAVGNTKEVILPPLQEEIDELFKIYVAFGSDEDNSILQSAFDSTPLETFFPCEEPNTSKGDRFLRFLLKNTIHAPVMLDFTKITVLVKMDRVASFIETVMSLVKQCKRLRLQFGPKIFVNVLKVWNQLSVNCDPFVLARILTGLVAIDMKKCLNSELIGWWCSRNVMGADNFDFQDKSEFVEFLGLFIQSKDPGLADNVVSAAENVIANSFPTTLSKGQNMDNFTKFLQQVFLAFERNPGNVKVQRLVISGLSKLSGVILEGIDLRFIYKDFTRRMAKLAQSMNDDLNSITSAILNTILDGFTANLIPFQYCLLPLLLNLKISAMKRFYRKSILILINLLDSPRHSTSQNYTQELNIDFIVYNLLAVLSRKCGGTFFGELTCDYQIHQKQNGVPEKETKTILKVLSAAFVKIKSQRLEQVSDRDRHTAVLRRNSAAYSALVYSIKAVDSIPNKQNLIEVLLIHDDIQKKKYLWENLVDCSKSIHEHFPVLLESKNNASSEEVNVPNIDSAVKVLHAEQISKMKLTLAGSSLIGEINGNFDFTGSFATSDAAFYQRIMSSSFSDISFTQLSAPSLSFSCSAFNPECVEGIVNAIKMLTCIPKENEVVHPWIRFLRDTLESQLNHENVKIFILGAILNCQEDLKCYGYCFVDSICKCIINDQVWKEPFNYFVKELLVMLLDWNIVPAADIKKRTIQYILENIIYQQDKYSRNDLSSHNLKLLDTVIVSWNVATDEIYNDTLLELLTTSSKIVLLICQGCIQRDILPTSDPSVLLRQVCKLFKDASKDVYSKAALLSGNLLRFMKEKSYNDMDRAEEYVAQKLNGERSRNLPFLNLLSQIQKSYPSIITQFQADLLKMLGSNSKLAGYIVAILFTTFKNNLNSEIDPRKAVEAFVMNLEGRRFFDSVVSTDEDLEIGLSLLESLLDVESTRTDLTLKIVIWLKLLEGTKNEAYQLRYYNCIGRTYFQFSNHAAENMRNFLLKKLLAASKNDKPGVKDVIDEFWSKIFKEQKSHEWLLQLIELLGDQRCSLHVILGRILHICSNGPDWRKKIFDKPLEDCLYFDYHLDTSCRTSQDSFFPLFAESLSTVNFTAIPETIQSSIMRQRHGIARFRATLATNHNQLQYSQTHNQTSNAEDETQPLMNEMETQNEISDQPILSRRSETLHLRKRFYVNRDEPGYFAAKSKKERLDKVKQSLNLTRSYRRGDVPDIMIENSDMLRTLIRLGQCDSHIGRLIVAQIFSAVLQESTVDKAVIARALDGALQNYCSMTPSIVATILDISVLSNVSLSPERVKQASEMHNLLELGIIALEKCLELRDRSENNAVAVPAPPKKRVRLEKNDSALLLHFAELYQCLEDYDVLKNIFDLIASENIEFPIKINQQLIQNTSSALELESNAQLEAALEKYSEVFHSKKSDESFSNFVECAFCKCLVKLSEWGQLKECIDEALKTGQSSLRRPWYSTQAQLMLTFAKDYEKNSNSSDANTFILQLEGSNYPQFYAEKAVLLFCSDLHNGYKSSGLLDKFWTEGISVFANFAYLSPVQRREQIIQFQLASALHDILDWHKIMDSDLEKTTNDWINKMTKLHGNKFCISTVCAEVITAMLSYFLKTFQSLDIFEGSSDLQDRLNLLAFNQNLWILSLGLRTGNSMLSNKYLQKSKTLGDYVSLEDMIQWRKLYIDYIALYQNITPLEEWLNMWTSAWKKVRLGGSLSKAQETEPADCIEMQAKLLKCLIISMPENSSSIPNRVRKAFNGAMMLKESSSMIEAIQIGSKKLLEFINDNNHRNSLQCESSFEVYSFINSLAKRFPDQYSSERGILTLKLEMLIKSMADEVSEHGVLLMPQLLDMLQNCAEVHSTFRNLWEIIPAWKFIPWLDQILSNCDFDENMRKLFEPIIQKISQYFPDALQFQDNALLKKGTNSDYVASLKALVLPTVQHKSIVDDIKTNVRDNDIWNLKVNLEAFKHTLQGILDNKRVYGRFHQEFSKKVVKTITAWLDKVNDPDDPMEGDSVSNSFETLKNELESQMDSHEKDVFKGRDVKNLEDFSPWLAKFHHIQYDDSIQIPGMFDHLHKPDVQSHPSIVFLNPTVTIYHSLARPIRVTFTGNDGKKRSFLAKYGDNLAQDRNVQQILRITNSMLNNSSLTRERQLGVTTYSVIPLSKLFGLIQWLDKTIDVSSFILRNEQLKHKRDQAAQMHQQWIQESSGIHDTKCSVGKLYWLAAKRTSRQSAERHYKKLSETTEESLFVNHMLDRSESFEKFFKIRQNCIRSYAAMCMVHWLLGIGDRHLQNSLQSYENGQLIGIDFGRSFEIANTLEVPEMIPFRLTPNFVKLMMPYGFKGLFKETMIATWRCLLQSSETIIFVLREFSNERNTDWRNGRQRKRTTVEPQLSVESGCKLEPMKIIQAKLSCKNPIKILLEVLRSNHSKMMPTYCDIVKDGRPTAESDDPLSVQEMVDCLLDLATDKNILSRIWVGFNAWI